MVKMVGNVSSFVDWWCGGCGGATAVFLRWSWRWLCGGKAESGEQSLSNHCSSLLLLFSEPMSANIPEPPDSPPNTPPLYSDEDRNPPNWRNPSFQITRGALSCATGKKWARGAQGAILHPGLLAGGGCAAVVRRNWLRFWGWVLGQMEEMKKGSLRGGMVVKYTHRGLD